VRFEVVTFVRCEGCGIVFRGSQSKELLDAGFYEEGYFNGRKSGREKRFEHRVRKGKSWLSDALALRGEGGGAMLDVGCSMGYLLEAGRRLGMTASGVDVSQYAADHCRSLGFDARVGTLEKLPFDDASFDVVVMKHVLEHTPSPLVALDEVKRVLKPGGVVLVAVPDLSYWKGWLMRRSGRYFRPDELGSQHYVYFHLDGLARALSTAGFEVRAKSKALFRSLFGWPRPLEALRFALLKAWQSAAAALRLRRELYVLARRS
jgi:SAM-dependent methyltransferase